MKSGIEIQLISIIISIACSLCGTFLVLRKMSMMSDSITHTILLGIVGAFFITHNLNSPLLIVGATAIGVITVWITEVVTKTKLVSNDSAIGIVFPLLFSIAIIIISRYASTIHLDTDAVLLGELAFAPFNRLIVNGVDIGPKALYIALVIFIINLIYVVIFYKELKVVTFDPMLALVMGFSPVFIHYSLMTIVSVTAVAAFESVGSILVVAFMVGPPICAYLLTDDLKKMLLLSAVFASVSSIIGYQFAFMLDVSIAGSIAISCGILFALTFIFAPKRGLIRTLINRKIQKRKFTEVTLLLHVKNNIDELNDRERNSVTNIVEHLQWDNNRLDTAIKALLKSGEIKIVEDILILTEVGVNTLNIYSKNFLESR